MHPPPPGKAWLDYATWDDRMERLRLPALHYRRLLEALQAEGTRLVDHARHLRPRDRRRFDRRRHPQQPGHLAAAAGLLGLQQIESLHAWVLPGIGLSVKEPFQFD